MKGVTIVVITGMSGSGKSIALRALEDRGFFCIDNLPVSLLPKLTELSGTTSKYNRFALVMDIREQDFLSDYEAAYQSAVEAGFNIQTVFLDANDDVLVRRFSETRRKHPLDMSGALMDSIREERKDVENLKQNADHVIDTSDLTVHELRRLIQERFGSDTAFRHPMRIHLMSFAFKNGLPVEADLVVDVRFLPNPYFVPALKNMTGLDAPVYDYVLSGEITSKFLQYYWQLLEFLLPYYEKEGKHYLTVGVGCTGGNHRSVAIVEALASMLPKEGFSIAVTHRELKQHRVFGQNDAPADNTES